MALATTTNRRQNGITGTRRTITWDTVTFNNNSDTLVIPGIKRIESIDYTPQTNVSTGFTWALSGGIVTLTIAYAGGALTGSMQISGL